MKTEKKNMAYLDTETITTIDKLIAELSNVSAGLQPNLAELNSLNVRTLNETTLCFNADVGGARCLNYNRRNCVWSCDRKTKIHKIK